MKVNLIEKEEFNRRFTDTGTQIWTSEMCVPCTMLLVMYGNILLKEVEFDTYMCIERVRIYLECVAGKKTYTLMMSESAIDSRPVWLKRYWTIFGNSKTGIEMFREFIDEKIMLFSKSSEQISNQKWIRRQTQIL